MVRVCDAPHPKSSFESCALLFLLTDESRIGLQPACGKSALFGVLFSGHRKINDPLGPTSLSFNFRNYLSAGRRFTVRPACGSRLVVVSIRVLQVRPVRDCWASSPQISRHAIESHG